MHNLQKYKNGLVNKFFIYNTDLFNRDVFSIKSIITDLRLYDTKYYAIEYYDIERNEKSFVCIYEDQIETLLNTNKLILPSKTISFEIF